MRLTFVFLLVVTAHTAFAEGGVLSGRVTDVAEGAPVAQAYVLVHRSGGAAEDIRVRVARDGKFSAELPAGFYDVFVTAIGFAPTASKVQVRVGQTTTYDPRIGMSEVESSETAFEQHQPLRLR